MILENRKNIVKVKGVNFLGEKEYKKESFTFGDINFKISKGEFVVFFGISNFKKSEILKFLTEFSKSKKEEVVVNSKTAFISNSFNLFTTLSVLDNVALPLIFLGMSKKQSYKEVLKVFTKFDILKSIHKFPQELSKKEELLCFLAMSYLKNPEIIILDNPTKKLGFKSSKEIFDILYKLNIKEKKTIIVEINDTEFFCYADKIFFLKDGEIVKEGISQKKPELFNVLSEKFKNENYINFAKALSGYFLDLKDYDLKNRLQKFILKTLKGDLTNGSLKELLKRSVKDGGLAFSEEKIKEILRRIEIIVLERKALEIEQKREIVDIGGVRAKLLKSFKRQLSIIQIERLEDAVENLNLKIINEKKFKKILTNTEIQAGIGLNVYEANKILSKLKILFKYE